MKQDNRSHDRPTIFTIGHSNRTAEDFIAILTAASVSCVIDVRRYPTSKYNPQFRGENLRTSLADVDIGYHHIPDFGGFRKVGKNATSLNTGWRNPFFQSYADYALSPEFQLVFRRFCADISPNAAIMCAERDWRDCHRQILADYLMQRNFSVYHLIDRETGAVAEPTAFSHFNGDGLIHYPPKPDAQIGFDF